MTTLSRFDVLIYTRKIRVKSEKISADIFWVPSIRAEQRNTVKSLKLSNLRNSAVQRRYFSEFGVITFFPSKLGHPKSKKYWSDFVVQYLQPDGVIIWDIFANYVCNLFYCMQGWRGGVKKNFRPKIRNFSFVIQVFFTFFVLVTSIIWPFSRSLFFGIAQSRQFIFVNSRWQKLKLGTVSFGQFYLIWKCWPKRNTIVIVRHIFSWKAPTEY